MAATVHLLKIMLRGVEPVVWRLVEVPSAATLDRLSDMLETAMGWESTHLHCFKVRGVTFWPVESCEYMEVADWQDETGYTVAELLSRPDAQLMWRYDMGDCWDHDVVVVSVAAGGGRGDARAGGGRCPPEDSGGVGRYSWLLEAHSDKSHPAHSEAVERFGENYDPFRYETPTNVASNVSAAVHATDAAVVSAAGGGSAARRWVPVGETVEIAGRAIIGGGFYVGSGDHQRSAGVIDPSLAVRWPDPQPDRDSMFGFGRRRTGSWDRGSDPSLFSYQECSPIERGLLLDWLTEYLALVDQPAERGYHRDGCPVQYWAWYLQGVERRLLADPDNGGWANPETAALVERLTSPDSAIDDYTYYPHLEGKRWQLTNFVCGMTHRDDVDVGDEHPAALPHVPHGYSFLIDVGKLVAAGRPVPAELAMRYAHLDNKASSAPSVFKLPEYDELLHRIYSRRHSAGLVVDAANLSELVIEHKPLTASLPVQRHRAGVPDVRASDDLKGLRDVITEAVEQLKPYARAVTNRRGRAGHRNHAGHAANDDVCGGYDASVVSRLPAELFDINPMVRTLRQWAQDIAGREKVQMTLSELSQRCNLSTDVLTPGEKAGVTETFKRLGIGCTPNLTTLPAAAKPATTVEVHALR